MAEVKFDSGKAEILPSRDATGAPLQGESQGKAPEVRLDMLQDGMHTEYTGVMQRKLRQADAARG